MLQLCDFFGDQKRLNLEEPLEVLKYHDTAKTPTKAGKNCLEDSIGDTCR